MQIIEQSVEFLRPYSMEMLKKDICETASISHKSEPKRTPQERNDFIKRLLKMGHLSVFENSVVSFRIVCSRTISHQIVRHRKLSFCQSSQRYSCYAHSKFNHEIKVIKPLRLAENSLEYKIWEEAMEEAEKAYFKLIEAKVPAEVAREVLPNSTATEMIVSGNIRSWIEYIQKRTVKQAQYEHQLIANKIKELLLKDFEELGVVLKCD